MGSSASMVPAASVIGVSPGPPVTAGNVALGSALISGFEGS